MRVSAFLLLLFGLSIFIVPSESVISCIQCAELHNSQLDPYWEQAGGKVECTNVRPTRCSIGLLEQTKEYARLAAAGGHNDVPTPNLPTSYRLGKGKNSTNIKKRKKTARQEGGGMDNYAGCMRVYTPLHSTGGQTQMFMGCLGVRGAADPCPAEIGCVSQSSPSEPFRPSEPSDMDVNVITCGCQIDACDPTLMYEVRLDESMCDGAGLQGPLKISLFLGLTLASLL